MATHIVTKQRRAFQVLWSALDRYLLPHLPHGVVLAISGGPDSRALLEACASWSKRKLGKMVVVSLDHGARHESQREAQLVAMRAKRLGFLSVHESLLNLSGSLGEQELRLARYKALMRIGKSNDCETICTAHHADDDAEGYFMALMGNGGGELGSSMEPVSIRNNFIMCRPFLKLGKKDLLNALSLSYITDFAEDRLDRQGKGKRAQVRNFIFPKLFNEAPGIHQGLVSFARHQTEQRKLIEELAIETIDWQGDEAHITLLGPIKKVLIIAALWHVLKKWSENKDLRSCQATIDALVDEISPDFAPRLDQSINAFNLKDLSVKHYQFPGVIVTKSSKNIVIRRI